MRLFAMRSALWLALFTTASVSLHAQDAPTTDAPAQAAPAGNADSGDKFDTLMAEWKTIITDLRKIQQDYRLATEADLPRIRKQYDEVLQKGLDLLPAIEEAAVARYQSNPGDAEAAMFLHKVAGDALEKDDYPKAYKLVAVLKEGGFDENALLPIEVVAAYGTENFGQSLEAFGEMREKNLPMDERVQQAGGTAAELQEKFAREKQLRAKEAEADDLPRVKFSTSKGDLVIELYENEAPDTVGNFVSLVEKKFYDGLSFHRVLPHFMAQGGDPKGDGSGGPGYHIYCECYEEDARHHFSGTLSMAHAGRNTGGSQFFLTFQATPHLDGKHTVFGRVIEGQEVLPKLTRRSPDGLQAPPADRILKAEVLRKRNHEYVPNKAS